MTLQKISHIFTKIALKPLRTNLFHIVLSAIFLTIGGSQISAQEINKNSAPIPPEKEQTSNEEQITDPETGQVIEIKEQAKPIQNDTNKKKSGLDASVKRNAEDYERFNTKTKQATLYNHAEVYYKDIELKAGIIVLDYEKNEMFAGRIKDSLGNYSQYPYFKQGNNVVEADSIHFNTETKNARVCNSRTYMVEFRVKV